MADLVEVRMYQRRHEAEMAKGLLADNGIEAIVSADDVGGFRPHLILGMAGIRLLVGKNDVEKAKEILSAWEEPAEEG